MQDKVISLNLLGTLARGGLDLATFDDAVSAGDFGDTAAKREHSKVVRLLMMSSIGPFKNSEVWSKLPNRCSSLVTSAAGLLRELFALDMIAADVTCGNCGVVAMVGETRLYGGVTGAIFRCAYCDSVVMRLVRTPIGLWFDMRGSQLLLAQSAP
jgi:hypothetical protein